MIEIHGRQIPTVLPELAPPGRTALLVVDMQNDLCRPDGAFARQGADVTGYAVVIPPLARLIGAARAAGVLVVFVKATTRPDHRSQSPAQLYFELRMQRSYGARHDGPFEFCLPGTWGHQVIGELGCRDTDTVIEKYRSSAFVGTALDLLLRSSGIQTVVVAGCTTEGCVDSTARSAGFLDYFPVVPRDCVASDSPELHRAGLLILEAYRAIVVDSGELIAVWSGPAGEPGPGRP
jgi:nicotinamidase-related amidase